MVTSASSKDQLQKLEAQHSKITERKRKVAFTMLYEDSWDLETLRCLARRHMHWIGETGGLNKKPAKEIDSVALKEFKTQCLLHGG
ncbi:hypothetical protein DY000_02001733 [Brassica cretica]|uniref:Uncharacterized protein n=1 Tax=Brassica cretica TaxID=69181 RepID=A0ABQ7CL21_BRACR|nr:hypothetical protein DY000_02001733 [Brassica cretica]